MLILLVIYVLGTSKFVQTQCLREHGPYQMGELSFDPCNDGFKDEMIFNIKKTHYRQGKVGRSTVDWCYTGWVVLPKGFDNSFEAVEEGFCEDSIGMWKKYQTKHMKDMCFLGLLHGFPHWIQAIRDTMKLSIFCPLEEGNYTISCLYLESDDKTHLAKVHPITKNSSRHRRSLYDQDISGEYFYGTYKHIVKYYLNNTRVGCYTFKRKYVPAGLPVDKYPESWDSPKTIGEMKRHLKSIMDAMVIKQRKNSPLPNSMSEIPDFFGRYEPPFLFRASPQILTTYIDTENREKLPEGAIPDIVTRSRYILYRSSNTS